MLYLVLLRICSPVNVLQVDVPLDYSLRQYVSVLYKVPRMQVGNSTIAVELHFKSLCALPNMVTWKLCIGLGCNFGILAGCTS